MKLARALGISHRRLLGWEPETTYAHDAAGRVVSSRPEPEWDAAERGKVLALVEWEATELCPLCGGPKDLCQASDVRYAAQPPIRCAYTDASSREQEQWRKDERPRPEALIPQLARST